MATIMIKNLKTLKISTKSKNMADMGSQISFAPHVAFGGSAVLLVDKPHVALMVCRLGESLSL